jgi:hypothetical protein
LTLDPVAGGQPSFRHGTGLAGLAVRAGTPWRLAVEDVRRAEPAGALLVVRSGRLLGLLAQQFGVFLGLPAQPFGLVVGTVGHRDAAHLTVAVDHLAGAARPRTARHSPPSVPVDRRRRLRLLLTGVL